MICAYYRNPAHPSDMLHTVAELPGTTWPSSRLGRHRQAKLQRKGDLNRVTPASSESGDASCVSVSNDNESLANDKAQVIPLSAGKTAFHIKEVEKTPTLPKPKKKMRWWSSGKLPFASRSQK